MAGTVQWTRVPNPDHRLAHTRAPPSILPSSHFPPRTFTARSHSAASVRRGCSFCLECPSHAVSLSYSFLFFKAWFSPASPGKCSLGTWPTFITLLCPSLCFPGCSTSHSFHKYLLSLCMPQRKCKVQRAQARSELGQARLGGLHPCNLWGCRREGL